MSEKLKGKMQYVLTCRETLGSYIEWKVLVYHFVEAAFSAIFDLLGTDSFCTLCAE